METHYRLSTLVKRLNNLRVTEDEDLLFIAFSFLMWCACIVFVNKENIGKFGYVSLASASFSSSSCVVHEVLSLYTEVLFTILLYGNKE